MFNGKSYSCGSLGRVRSLTAVAGAWVHGQANWVNVPVTQAVLNGITLLDIEVSPNNGDHVFTVGGAASPAASPQFFGVAVSTNGGTTWNIPGGSYQAAAGNTILNGNVFQWNEIVVVGPQVYGVSGMSVIVGSIDTTTSHGTIAISNDGGANYNTIPWYSNLLLAPNPPMGDKECTAVHFPNTSVGVVALNQPGALDAWVIKTTDGGGTWLILNGQNFLTTALFPNPPATVLPIHAITGISILANQEHIIGVGQDFIISTEGVVSGSPTAGVAADSWRNNFETSTGFGPPVYWGFQTNLPIGWHLGTYPVPNEDVIWVSGDSELGIHSVDHGVAGWTVTPGLGWDNSGMGDSRRAAHFYNYVAPNTVPLEGFYNLSSAASNKVYWNPQGFAPAFAVLSDDLPGLNYSPTAIWTWYEELPPPPCFKLENCLNASQVLYTQSTCLNGQPFGFTVQLAAPYNGICWKIVDPLGACINPVPVVCLGFNNDCQSAQCNPVPTPCACPQGTTQVTLPDGTIVCRQDTVVLAQGPVAPAGCQRNALGINNPIATTPTYNFGPSPQYSRYGAKFYGETSGIAWPINFTTGCAISTQAYNAFPATPLPIVSSISNAAWGTGNTIVYDGRVNAGAGYIMSNTPCGSSTLGGRYGTIFCLNVPNTTTYSFGFMGMGIEILINGLVFVQSTNQDVYQYETWTVMQLTLPAGNYIIQMASDLGGLAPSCGGFTFNTPPFAPRIPGSIAGAAFEIYNTGITALAAMTSQAQVDATLIYSTKNEDGLPLDYGSTIYNYRCPCPLPPALCPDSIGQYNLIVPILDNCTANPLNPNADPRIYVCHTYKYTALAGCCYLLTDCVNPAITHITSTDLAAYVGFVITVQEYIGCFIVSQVPCPVPSPTPVTFIQSYGTVISGGCAACAPKCYLLTDCDDIVSSIITSTDLSLYLGGVVNIAGSSTCWQVSLASDCQGNVPVVITNTFQTCLQCAPVCYLLENCADAADIKITNTDLSLYVGQVIYIDGCPGVCWQVFIANDCTNAVPVIFLTSFADCETCNPTPPPPPVILRDRSVKPGYNTPGCDPQYTETVSCRFANAAYDQMIIVRYGITLCCNEPIEKWDIKKQLLDLRALYDPELCKNAMSKCCPPCAIVAFIEVYPVPITCPPPTGVVAVLTVPPISCPPPTNIQVGIIVNPTTPCVCYVITLTNPATGPCSFDYPDCNGVIQTEIVTGVSYVCSIGNLTTLCPPGTYQLQATADSCLLGTCGPPIPCNCFKVVVDGSDGIPHTFTFTDCTGTFQTNTGGTSVTYLCGSNVQTAGDPNITVTGATGDPGCPPGC